MKQLPDKYDHREAEKHWQDEWEKKFIYQTENLMKNTK